MRRWNSWGDEYTDMPLPAAGREFLEQQLGCSAPLPEKSLIEVCHTVPPSRLPQHPLISTSAEDRIRHARGQSFPDWLAMRSGQFGCFPDGVAFPESRSQVVEILQLAKEHNWVLIPYGGGTSVAGHINPVTGERPVLTVDMGRMNQLLALDRDSQIATFGAGTAGPQVEAQLRSRGYTLGHFPQSWELSTLGGWVASRSSGQQSLRYGRIEQLFAGGRLETLQGSLALPTYPASAAGPDLREIVLGSEGRMGILSEVKVRVTPLPESECFYVVFLPSWQKGLACVKAAVQEKIALSMLRLSNPIETFTQLKLAGHPRMIGYLERYLKLSGAGADKCMLTFGVTGSRAQTKAALSQFKRVIRFYSGVLLSKRLGKKWEEGRFRYPYMRESLWQAGVGVDTVETAVDWPRVDELMVRLEQSLKDVMQSQGEPIHVFSHLSHVYSQGASVYTTYLFPLADSYDESLKRWQALKQAASETIISNGGTISHQHGVGKDHAPYLTHEKSARGIEVLSAIIEHFDPEQRLNPDTLLPSTTLPSTTLSSTTSAKDAAISSYPDVDQSKEKSIYVSPSAT